VAGGAVALILSTILACTPARHPVGSDPAPVESGSPRAGNPSEDRPIVFEKPPPRPGDFVGSAACSECHGAIAERYAGHPMARPVGAVGCGIDAGEAAPSPTGFSVGPRSYEVACRAGGMVHVERVRDDRGLIVEREVPIRFALGSGSRGKTYLVDRGGKLFQSPIGWYTGRGGYDLSPGYREDPGLGFERAIGDGCLFCHAGRVEHDQARPDRFTPRVFAEEAIGCERCHGPGGPHVAAMRSAAEQGRAAIGEGLAIVNPARLDPERREAVCNQCHLIGEAVIPRYGRGFFDFRPGDRLDDVFVVLVNAADHPDRVDAPAPAVSHVEQMHRSRCFIGSDGRLGCTSCHDPHGVPETASREAFYRSRCNACHGDEACTLAADERESAPASGSCIACHMPRAASLDVPHTAVTDHRVRRRPASEVAHRVQTGRMPSPPDARSPAVFGDAAARLPEREVDRAIGLHRAGQAAVRRDPKPAREALGRLVPDGQDPIPLLGDDLESLLSVADLLDTLGEAGAAAACRGRVLELDPSDESALEGLSIHRQRQGNLAEALRLVDRLLVVNPWIAGVHARRAVLLGGLGRWKEGIAAAEAALGLDPTLVPMRRWLVTACRRAGFPDRAEKEQSIEARLEKALRDPGR
jgi:hypothetical protein